MASQFCLSGFGNVVPDFHNLFGYSFNFYTEQVSLMMYFSKEILGEGVQEDDKKLLEQTGLASYFNFIT